MKLPSEAELIEMERRAEIFIEDDYDFQEIAHDVLTLVAIVRQLGVVAPIPAFPPRRKRRRVSPVKFA